ncbi:MAG: helix-turn-helix transcriptional regulator [Deltaproteobacteria bacterium]|nr:helix-turn-helix transcriptional regulator [Deltaproteobacteria bacterium]
MKQNVNNVRKLREAKMMSKAELARKAGISVLTVDRIEKGYPCRLDTKRKIVLALGFRVPEAEKVFKNSQKAGVKG